MKNLDKNIIAYPYNSYKLIWFDFAMELLNYEFRYFRGQSAPIKWGDSSRVIAKIGPQTLQDASLKIHGHATGHLVFRYQNLRNPDEHAHFFLYGRVGMVVAREEIRFKKFGGLDGKEEVDMIVISAREKGLTERAAVEFGLPTEGQYSLSPSSIQEANHWRRYFNGVIPQRWEREQISAQELSRENTSLTHRMINSVAGSHIIFKSRADVSNSEHARFFLYKDVGIATARELTSLESEAYSDLTVLSCKDKDKLEEVARELRLR